ncbi:MAG: hypothetical protein U0931_33380 [Vulcanimicrobiota bacterium]
MQLQYSLICLGYDETKGPPTFQHVISELPLSSFPYQFPEGAGIFVVNGWHGLPEKCQCKLQMSFGEDVLMEERFTLSGQGVFQLSLIFLEGLLFEQPGQYWVSVWADDKRHAHYPLHVVDAEE